VPKDLGKAAELYQKAADQGNARAQSNLGRFYETGRGVPKDLSKAAELYQKAANQGNARAQYHLGWLYEFGDGVPKDLGKAAELYQKAANQGDEDAIASLQRLSNPGSVSGESSSPASEVSPQPAASIANSSQVAASPEGSPASTRKHRLTYAPAPAFPPNAQPGLSGTGRFRLTFDAEGNVTNVQVIQSTGNQLLDQAAIQTLRQWRSAPSQGWATTVPITFQAR